MHQKVPVLLLHPPIVPLSEDSIFNTPARICCQADALVRAEGVDGLDQADRADGDQVVLMVGLGVVLLEDAFLKANLPRS